MHYVKELGVSTKLAADVAILDAGWHAAGSGTMVATVYMPVTCHNRCPLATSQTQKMTGSGNNNWIQKVSSTRVVK